MNTIQTTTNLKLNSLNIQGVVQIRLYEYRTKQPASNVTSSISSETDKQINFILHDDHMMFILSVSFIRVR